MITSGELTKEIARALGFPEVMIGTYYRRLREENLVPKAGRGPRSSAPMTPAVASTLLTAIGGRRFETEAVGDIVREFQTVRSLKSCAWRKETTVSDGVRRDNTSSVEGDGRWDLGPFHIASLEALPDRHTPTEFLEAILNAYVGGEIDQAEDQVLPGQSHKIHRHIQVEFYGPLASAGIEIFFVLPDGRTYGCEIHYWSDEIVEQDAASGTGSVFAAYTADDSQELIRGLRGDLLMCRIFTAQTIKLVGGLFHWDRWRSMSEEEQEDHYIEQSIKYGKARIADDEE